MPAQVAEVVAVAKPLAWSIAAERESTRRRGAVTTATGVSHRSGTEDLDVDEAVVVEVAAHAGRSTVSAGKQCCKIAAKTRPSRPGEGCMIT